MPKFLRWSTYRLRTKGLIVVGLPLLPLAVFWLVVAVAIVQQPTPVNTETRSLTVQAGLAHILNDLLDADAGARQYLLTENAASHRRYAAAIERLPAHMAILENAVIDPELRGSLSTLDQLVRDELAVLGRLVGRPPPGFPVMGELAALDTSLSTLDRIRTLSATMEKRQATLADELSLQRYRRRQVYFLAFLVGSVLCAGGGIMAATVLAKGVSRRAAALAANADRLAHGLPPQPVPAGEDEIGLVDARLREAAKLLRKREVALRERTAQLEAANRELEAFSYSVSHDLRAPLRAIDGFSEALEVDCGDEITDEARDSLRRIRAAARRMGTLIDELLNLSRLTRVELRRQSVDLSDLATTVASDLARRHPDHPMDIRVEPGLVADADPELARIALHNLFDNAWKYTSRTDQPVMEVGASMNGHGPVFHVRDNGAGFDMTYASKLFTPFQRLHAERDFEGTGVGLAIVHRIVTRHGGRIWAEADIDHGATFYFTLQPEANQST